MHTHHKSIFLLVVLVLLLGLAAVAHAQDAVETIEYGQTVDASISATTAPLTYTFHAQKGDVITISMDSEEFDPYLSLVGVDGEEIAWDDDGGGYPNALIGPYVIPATGDYQIKADSSGGDESGKFTLNLKKVTLTPLSFDEPLDVQIMEDTVALYFSFEGKTGDVVNIGVDSSGTLDTRLRVRGSDSTDLASDDDSGGGYDPLINRFILPQDGQYIVILEPYTVGVTGTVQLSLTHSVVNSLDEGPQTITLSDKQYRDLVKFTGTAGEQVRLMATVSSGTSDYLTITVSQGGQDVAYINGNNMSEVSFVVTIPDDGEAMVRLESYSSVIIQVSLEHLSG